MTGSITTTVLMCHAPIVLPEIGEDRATDCAASTDAMAEAARAAIASRPDVLVVVSPHAARPPRSFSIANGAELYGDFARFGAPALALHLPLASEASSAIVTAARELDVDVRPSNLTPLDHGTMVPLWFVARAGWHGPTVVIGFPGEPALDECVRLGEAIARAAAGCGQRWALVASGDMSHRLKPGAPSGFHPRAGEFDAAIVRAVRAGDLRAAIDVDPGLRDLAAEDVVDSLAVAAGATSYRNDRHRTLSYEGPFGVGYLVAVLFDGTGRASEAPRVGKDDSSAEMSRRDAGKQALLGVAREAIAARLEGRSFTPRVVEGEKLRAPGGVFVTLWAPGHALRGCIGSLEESADPVASQVAWAAVAAATRDHRFEPMRRAELDDVSLEVSLLGAAEPVASLDDLDPKTFGIIVSQGARRGVLLPEVDGVDTVAQQVAIAARKGGVDTSRPYEVRRFVVEKVREQQA